MIEVRKKTLFNYADEKFFPYIYDKSSNAVFTKDFGLLIADKDYFTSQGMIHINRFYMGHYGVMIEYRDTPKKLKSMRLDLFLKFLWIEYASRVKFKNFR